MRRFTSSAEFGPSKRPARFAALNAASTKRRKWFSVCGPSRAAQEFRSRSLGAGADSFGHMPLGSRASWDGPRWHAACAVCRRAAAVDPHHAVAPAAAERERDEAEIHHEPGWQSMQCRTMHKEALASSHRGLAAFTRSKCTTATASAPRGMSLHGFAPASEL